VGPAARLRLAERLAGPVVLSAATRRITQDEDGVVVAADGHELRARHVVVAVPPLLAGHIDYEPGLPPWRDQLTQRMPMGSVTKCMAVYDEPFWRGDGLTGQVTDDVAGAAHLRQLATIGSRASSWPSSRAPMPASCPT